MPPNLVSIFGIVSRVLLDATLLAMTWLKTWNIHTESLKIGIRMPLSSLLLIDGTHYAWLNNVDVCSLALLNYAGTIYFLYACYAFSERLPLTNMTQTPEFMSDHSTGLRSGRVFPWRQRDASSGQGICYGQRYEPRVCCSSVTFLNMAHINTYFYHTSFSAIFVSRFILDLRGLSSDSDSDQDGAAWDRSKHSNIRFVSAVVGNLGASLVPFTSDGIEHEVPTLSEGIELRSKQQQSASTT